MNNNLQELFNAVPREIHLAAAHKELSTYGFTQFADQAYHVLRGLNTLAMMLEANKLLSADEEAQDNPLLLDDYHTGSLLSMMRSVSAMAADNITEVVNRAKHQLEQQQAGKGAKA